MSERIRSAYVHIPFCVKKCPYCDFVSYANRTDQKSAYVEAVCKEIRMTCSETAQLPDEGQTGRSEAVHPGDAGLATVYFGGGTPSLLSSDQIGIVLMQLRESIGIQQNAEITLEVNPGTVTEEDFVRIREAGITRISIGIQSFSSVLLASIGRIHTAEQARDAVAWAKSAGFANISCDLMTGLPGQTVADALDSLAILLEYEIPHISFYALTLEEGTPFFERFHGHEEYLPDSDSERDMYHILLDTLQSHGYDHYEISNCAKPGFESRHNLTYWKALPYYGFGCGAASYLHTKRIGNTPDLDMYLQCMGSGKNQLSDIRTEIVEVDEKERRKEFMLLGFRLLHGVSGQEFSDRFNVQMDEIFAVELRDLADRGWIMQEADTYRLTSKGLDFANIVFRAFV